MEMSTEFFQWAVVIGLWILVILAILGRFPRRG